MKVDDIIDAGLATAAERARRAEQHGYDGIWTAESGHDPLLPLTVAAEHTERITIGTSIVVAFGRTPMSLAYSAWDLHRYAGGRFVLGLGSQVRAHIERRYSMPWSQPAARMREFVAALRAIWTCWQDGTALDFRGDFYSHTLMTPAFSPGPVPHAMPKVFLAAVGQGMTKVAAETADGMLLHGFTTERYFREVTLPAVEAGLATRNATLDDFEFSYPAFVVTGTTEEEMAAATAATRKRIAFYASTPAYRGVLDLHGWGELHTELNTLSKQGEWDEMGRRISDEVLDAFAVRGEPHEVPAVLTRRFGDVIDRVSLYMPYAAEQVAPLVVSGLQDLDRRDAR
jgi:probable F420-dependent oxidoreductase